MLAATAPKRRATARPIFMVCLAALGLAACGTAPEKIASVPDMVAWRLHQQQLEQLGDWSFNGRIAVRNLQADGWNASLHWQQQGEHYDIQLSGALGQGAARIHGNGDSAVMETADQPPRIAPNPEALMDEQLGWHVPVRGLKYWLTGRPSPDAFDMQVIDGLGRLNRLEQSGWEVLYSRYEQIDGVELPRKLEMSNQRLRVRLVIDQWSFDSKSKI